MLPKVTAIALFRVPVVPTEPGQGDGHILFACQWTGLRTSLRGITVNTFLITVLSLVAVAVFAALGYLFARHRAASENRDLRNEQGRLQTALKVAEEQRDQARARMEELRHERDGAQESQREREAAATGQSTKLEAASGRIGTLEAELNTARDEQRRAGAETGRLQENLEASRREVRELSSALETAGKTEAGLRAVIAQHEEHISGHRAELAQLRTERETLEKQQAGVDATRRQIEEMREEHTRLQAEQFEATVAKVLEASQEKLTATADKRLGATAKEVGDKLQALETHLREFDGRRTTTETRLDEQIKNLARESVRGREQTEELVRALRKPQVRGQWGELQLKRTVELANMREHVDFDLQVSVTDDDGRTLRPDMVVKLTGGRQVVVDAKVSLDAFLSALEAADDTERDRLMGEHSRQVRKHVDSLAAKAYFDKVDGSPQFVLMFLPSEALLQAALDQDSALYEYALRKKVVIASPTVLVPMLLTIALTWTEARMKKNAQEIHKLGRDIYERFAPLVDHLEKLGRSIDKSVEHYNATIGSLERSVLPAARRFPELGVSSSKELPELHPVESQTRELKAPELVQATAPDPPLPALEAAEPEPEAAG